MPTHLHRMVYAELQKILTRASGWAGLALSLLVPVVVLIGMSWVQSQTTGEDALVLNNNPISQMVQLEVLTALDWSLTIRNFFVLKLILLMVTAQLVAGEWKDRTLRTLLVRPVPRWSVLLAKFLAVQIYAGICVAITYVFTVGPAMALFDSDADIGPASLAFLVTWGTDAGVIALGMLVSTIFPSVVGVVVGTAMFLGAELALRGGLQLASFLGMEGAEDIGPWMPGNALDAWQGFSTGWDERALGGLGILIVLCAVVSVLRFERTDVP
ncbi:MAG: ABC transporter permease subunit [Proteobacteria bacterium]|nr:ABC transporter permease subunit [Pseudomonadota bacterium]MCP4918671.1 ABC transporter permease subunit [Pseudomonadota bacterium]